MPAILGIDPGLSGAWALLSDDGRITAGDLPVVQRSIDVITFDRLVRGAEPVMAVVENVHAMPKQGVASMFNFGGAHHAVLATLLLNRIPVHLVSPGCWKKHFRLGADKEASRALALRMWPAADCFGRRKDHGRAEAALIALYGEQSIARRT